ncbi:MAG: DNA polymerase ligase N-terminal domain-containing protein [Planctomycetota bacterium]|jgi:bifunctional non-homologous end joining protein LigD
MPQIIVLPRQILCFNIMKMSEEDKRFVIQKHTQGKNVHWDFMLQSGEVLQTYRLDKAPEEVLRQTANAVKIFNHPLKFLTYQGAVNKGRGNVRLTEAGTYQIIHQKHNRIELSLNGQILKGKFTLIHIKNDDWQFTRDSPPARTKIANYPAT